MRFENSVTIGRPLDTVFGYLSDIANAPAWQAPVLEARQTSAGPLGAGTTFDQAVAFMGRRYAVTTTVVAYEPPLLARLRTVGGPAPLDVTFRLTPLGGGTRVDTVTAVATGGMLKLTAPLAAQAMRRAAQNDLETLKRILEHGAD